MGRFLTAIAFLTAAAIAFCTRSDVLGVRYDLDGSVPLPGVLFAGFIVFVVVAVVFLLMALGQALRPPTVEVRHLQPVAALLPRDLPGR